MQSQITPQTAEGGLNGLDLFSQESSSPSSKRQDSLNGLDCRSAVMMPSPSPSPSSSSSTSSFLMGDYIGMESCVDVLKEGDESLYKCPEYMTASAHTDRFRCKRDQRLEMMRKAFPPPIPLLARTENLPCRMPWVLKRHYTSDGRLILTEEKVRHHEYFRAHRSNGRLTLQLVPLDDDGSDSDNDDVSGDAPPLIDGVADSGEEENDNVDCDDKEEVVAMDGGDDDGDGGDDVEEEERNRNRNGIDEVEESSKCLNYVSSVSVSVRSAGGSCCIFGMAAVPAIKTVHS